MDLNLRPIDALAAGGELAELFRGRGGSLCVHVKSSDGRVQGCVHVKSSDGRVQGCAQDLAATQLAGVYRKLTRE